MAWILNDTTLSQNEKSHSLNDITLAPNETM